MPPQISLKFDLNKFGAREGMGILVVDSFARGIPAKGGIRIHSNVSEEEISSLSHEMTLKCILADLPFGGAKGGIKLENYTNIEESMFAFGRTLAKFEILPSFWCAAPDVNTDSKSVDAFVAGCASVKGWRSSRFAATGKSTGIPHELGSTAYSVILSLKEVLTIYNFGVIAEKKFIVEGRGEVGGNAVRFLTQTGAKILGISDIGGYIYKKEGIPEEKISLCINTKKTLQEISKQIDGIEYGKNPADLLVKQADILILAGPGRSVNEKNHSRIKVKVIAEGANIAYTSQEVRDKIFSRNIISIPGIICNSGGVISSYEEWLLETQNLAHIDIKEKWEKTKSAIESKVIPNVSELFHRVKENNEEPYRSAIKLSQQRLERYIKVNKELEKATKEINEKLEEKFRTYTS